MFAFPYPAEAGGYSVVVPPSGPTVGFSLERPKSCMKCEVSSYEDVCWFCGNPWTGGVRFPLGGNPGVLLKELVGESVGVR